MTKTLGFGRGTTRLGKIALIGSAVSLFTMALGACGESSASQSEQTVDAMHAQVLTQLDALITASKALRDAAPLPTGRGWDATLDATALADMRTHWHEARVAYEHVEGALAPIFPDLDASIDARYDDDLADNGPDTNLFDDQNVTGLHAIERILYSDSTPANVVALEKSLPGYAAAAFPSTEAEAKAFHDVLCAKLIADAQKLHDGWTPANIDLPGAFTGLVDLMGEQREKVNKAGDQEEESRYAQNTMADLRANLEGTRSVYETFRPWLITITSSDSEKDGPTLDKAIAKGFDELAAVYAQYPGDAFPPPPEGWSAESPSADNLATPFGKLFTAVTNAVDPGREGSVVHEMNHAGEALGLQ